MRSLRTLNQWLLKGVEAVLIILILGMVFLGFGQVVLRKFFDKSFSNIFTLIQFSVIWIAFLGAVLATQRQNHIKIDILAQVISEKFNRWLLAVVNLAGIVMCVVLAKGGLTYLRTVTSEEWAMDDNPIWNASFLIGFGLITVEFAFGFLEVITGPLPEDGKAETGDVEEKVEEEEGDSKSEDETESGAPPESENPLESDEGLENEPPSDGDGDQDGSELDNNGEKPGKGEVS